MPDSDEWSELDQVSVRTSLRDLFESMPDPYDQHAAALGKFREIVQEEVARAFSESLNVCMTTAPKDSRTESEALVAEVNRDLDRLGLCIRDPASDAPCRLGLATRPPSGPNESWLTIQPMHAAARSGSIRLARPVPALELMPAPPGQTPPARGR